MDTTTLAPSLEAAAAEAEGAAMDDFGGMFDEELGGDPAEAPRKPALKKPTAAAKAKPATPAPEAGDEEPEDEEEDEPSESEVEEEPEEETAEDDNDEEDDDDEIRDPKKVQAMLDKRKRQRDKAREERDAVMAELESLRTAQPVTPLLLQPTPETPVSHLYRPDELESAERQWKAELEWCKDHLAEGGSRPGADGKLVEWDAAQVRRRFDQTLSVLQTHLPKQREFAAQFQSDIKDVAQRYPFLAKGSPLHQAAADFGQEVLDRAPGLAAHPRHISLLARAFIGEQILSGKYRALTGRDGRVQLVPVTGESDGSGKPKVVKPAADKPVLRKPGTPPVRPSDRKTDLRERLEHGSPEEAAAAELDDLWEDTIR